MKYLMNLGLLLTLSVAAKAQDLIVKRDASEINAKVLEVGPEFVKYRDSANVNGPTYVLKRKDIFFIKYQNGMKDVITQLPQGNTAKAKKEVFYLSFAVGGSTARGDYARSLQPIAYKQGANVEMNMGFGFNKYVGLRLGTGSYAHYGYENVDNIEREYFRGTSYVTLGPEFRLPLGNTQLIGFVTYGFAGSYVNSELRNVDRYESEKTSFGRARIVGAAMRWPLTSRIALMPTISYNVVSLHRESFNLETLNANLGLTLNIGSR